MSCSALAETGWIFIAMVNFDMSVGCISRSDARAAVATIPIGNHRLGAWLALSPSPTMACDRNDAFVSGLCVLCGPPSAPSLQRQVSLYFALRWPVCVRLAVCVEPLCVPPGSPMALVSTSSHR